MSIEAIQAAAKKFVAEVARSGNITAEQQEILNWLFIRIKSKVTREELEGFYNLLGEHAPAIYEELDGDDLPSEASGLSLDINGVFEEHSLFYQAVSHQNHELMKLLFRWNARIDKTVLDIQNPSAELVKDTVLHSLEEAFKYAMEQKCELEKVQARAKKVREAFDNVKDHLFTEMGGRFILGADLKVLRKKSMALDDAMLRITAGDAPVTVLSDLEKSETVRSRRGSAPWKFIQEKFKRSSKTVDKIGAIKADTFILPIAQDEKRDVKIDAKDEKQAANINAIEFGKRLRMYAGDLNKTRFADCLTVAKTSSELAVQLSSRDEKTGKTVLEMLHEQAEEMQKEKEAYLAREAITMKLFRWVDEYLQTQLRNTSPGESRIKLEKKIQIINDARQGLLALNVADEEKFSAEVLKKLKQLRNHDDIKEIRSGPFKSLRTAGTVKEIDAVIERVEGKTENHAIDLTYGGG